ncbi:hypothetical protein [Kurthia huakuii]|uniref:hypothetical protein n=1 Tax=Kurthia huakuii TaxID=1421019 RepID=UPI0004956D69|nr:hypothetical protein [Kurthia huakuii]MBM7699183.1 hypothetical protein [Kurthia huakuii]
MISKWTFEATSTLPPQFERTATIASKQYASYSLPMKNAEEAIIALTKLATALDADAQFTQPFIEYGDIHFAESGHSTVYGHFLFSLNDSYL